MVAEVGDRVAAVGAGPHVVGVDAGVAGVVGVAADARDCPRRPGRRRGCRGRGRRGRSWSSRSCARSRSCGRARRRGRRAARRGCRPAARRRRSPCSSVTTPAASQPSSHGRLSGASYPIQNIEALVWFGVEEAARLVEGAGPARPGTARSRRRCRSPGPRPRRCRRCRGCRPRSRPRRRRRTRSGRRCRAGWSRARR